MFYRTFYRLPARWRRRIVRLGAPRYIVGAVTLVHDTEDTGAGRLLLLRQPPGRGWSLPGGLLNHHEPAALGAARELAEETGVTLTVDDLTPATPSALVHHDGHWVDMVFLARVAASQVTLTADGAEVFEARFHPLDDLPTLTAPTARLLGVYGIGPRARRG